MSNMHNKNSKFLQGLCTISLNSLTLQEHIMKYNIKYCIQTFAEYQLKHSPFE